MITKFGPLPRYTSLDEVYHKLKLQFKDFDLSITTSSKSGIITHSVRIAGMVNGFNVVGTAEGTGNVADVIIKAMDEVDKMVAEAKESPKVKGTKLLKPVIRQVDTLSKGVTLTPVETDSCCEEEYYCRDCEMPISEHEDTMYDGLCESCFEDLHEFEEDEKCNGDDYNECCEYNDEAEEQHKRVKITFIGKVGEVSMNNEEKPVEPVEEEQQPVAESTIIKKLCCEVARTKGYKFCPDCGSKIQ